MQIYNQIITGYNLFCPKNIPFRSEALCDFLQATILDEMHQFFKNLDEAYQNQFRTDIITIQEKLRQITKLESLVQTSLDRLSYIKRVRES